MFMYIYIHTHLRPHACTYIYVCVYTITSLHTLSDSAVLPFHSHCHPLLSAPLALSLLHPTVVSFIIRSCLTLTLVCIHIPKF